MNLSELICNRMRDDEQLEKMLAVYYDKTAVFEDEVPADQQDGWGRRTQYPRICYHINMQANQERSSSGELMVTVQTRKDSPLINELENYIKSCLQDVIMTPEGSSPFCVAWSKSESFVHEGLEIISMVLSFDILEYASQQTTDPDPVVALSNELKYIYPEAVIIGMDALEDYMEPAIRPVIYARLQSISETSGHCEHSIVWFLVKMAIHILCPSQDDRLKMASGIFQALSMREEITMMDDSPMIIQGNVLNNKADYLRDGQITLTCKYGCLRKRREKKKIRTVYNNYLN